MTHTTEQLLPCPFCGEMPNSHVFPDEFGGMQVDCPTANCPASPITTGNSMFDPLIAFTAWNRRTPTAELIAAHKRIAELEAELAQVKRERAGHSQRALENGMDVCRKRSEIVRLKAELFTARATLEPKP